MRTIESPKSEYSQSHNTCHKSGCRWSCQSQKSQLQKVELKVLGKIGQD